MSHGDVLLVGPVVALLARPDSRQVHERPPGDDADGELGLARRTDAHPGENREKNRHKLASGLTNSAFEFFTTDFLVKLLIIFIYKTSF